MDYLIKLCKTVVKNFEITEMTVVGKGLLPLTLKSKQVKLLLFAFDK